MKFKEPDFRERVARAAQAKQKALEALRARPAVDPDVLAERREAQERRQTAQAEARADKKAAQLAAKLRPAEQPAGPTEAERKAERDRRYAARKRRR